MIPTPARKLILRGLIPALALLAVPPSQAQSLADCAAIEDPDQRLSCFDSLATGKAAADPAPAIAPKASSAPTVTQSASGSAVPAAAAGTAAASQSNTTVSGVSSYQELFGLENEAAKKGIKEIQSRIVDDFDGWSGNTVFTLENGQVWKQLDVNSKLSWRGDSHPMATVKRKTFSSYMLGVEGSNKMVRVKRVK